MMLSPTGRRLIQHHEALRLEAYLCPAGVWTIGWGHTGSDVHEGLVITRDRAEELFTRDVSAFEAGVNRLVHVPVSQAQFDALVSFAFNVGLDEDVDDIPEGLGDSTLLRLLNAGDYEGAAQEFPKWRRGGGRVLPGLVRRRAEEQALFLSQMPAARPVPMPVAPPASAEPVRSPRGISAVPDVVEHDNVHQSGSVQASRIAAGAATAGAAAIEATPEPASLADAASTATHALRWVDLVHQYGPWLLVAVIAGAWAYIEFRRRRQIAAAKP
ncbi:lysozyme [Maricaulis sp.]|uniref:lysozyme n=1 Tax=Maricaulis sp. TaxID=1486257 RepID=UPI003299336A